MGFFLLAVCSDTLIEIVVVVHQAGPEALHSV
jgi:hypothetical protein